jgi:hypothetical protein
MGQDTRERRRNPFQYARGAMMELHKNAPHQRALVHSRSGTNLLIRGFKFHDADESKNADLSFDHAGHAHRRVVRGSCQPRGSTGAFRSRRRTSMFAWRDLLCRVERNTIELRPYRAPRALCQPARYKVLLFGAPKRVNAFRLINK